MNKYVNDDKVIEVLANTWNEVTEVIEHKNWRESSYNPDYLVREPLTKIEKNGLINYLMKQANTLWNHYLDKKVDEAYAAYADMLNVISWLRISSFD